MMLSKTITESFLKLLLLVILLTLFSSASLAYKQTPPNQVVHQYITNESQNVWSLLPYEIKSKMANDIYDIDIDGSYDVGDDIITGSGEEDLDPYVIFPAIYRNHYWDPDIPQSGKYNWGLFGYQSNYQKAKNIWNTLVIPNYIKGNIDESYYWLGRVVHLLEDISQPGHVLNDCHAGVLWEWVPCLGADSALEIFTASNNNYWGDTTGKMNIQHFKGSNYLGQQYNYENLIPNFNWNYIEPTKRDYLFRLFWYTAQKTQYFASDAEEQNFNYKTISGSTYDWSCSGTGDTNLWAGESYTSCSNFINKGQMQIDDPSNNGAYVSAEASGVIPHSMKAVAGIYRLFWDTVHSYSWPTFHHDNQRTGFTLLKGDLTSASKAKKKGYTLSGDTETTYVVRASIADLDNNGEQEIVIASKQSATDGKVFSLEYTGSSFTNKWEKDIGKSVTVPPSLDDIDNDGYKEVVFGLGNNNGTLFVLNGNNGNIEWTYTVPERWSNYVAMNIRGSLGYTAIADLDNDGDKEVIFAEYEDVYDWPGNLYVFDGNGNKLDDIEVGNGGAPGAISIANIDSDDNLEIIVPSYYGIRVYDYSGGSLSAKSAWNSNSDGKIEGAAVIYDADKDDEYELIYTTSTKNCYSGKTCYNRTYVRDALTGSLEHDIDINAVSRVTPSIANLDADNNLEIVITTRDSPTTSQTLGKILCYDANTENQDWSYSESGTLRTDFISPDIFDSDNDGNYNVVFPYYNSSNLYFLDNGGSKLFHYSFGGIIGAAPAIGDIFGKGTADIAVKHAGSPLTEMSVISGNNSKPILNNISNIIANETNLININASGEITAIDMEGDSLTFYYSSPFNESGFWNTSCSDAGNYSILIEVSDGNLSDWKYINLTINETCNGAPTSILESPSNNTNTTYSSITFVCGAYDSEGLANVTLYTDIGGIWRANQTKVIKGYYNETNFTITDISIGSYKWNCLVYDNYSTGSLSDWMDSNYTFNIIASDSWCYQETANISTACGGLSTGSYGSLGSFSASLPFSNSYDGDWSSAAGVDVSFTSYIYTNYSKPDGAKNTSLYMFNNYYSTMNRTIPKDCWSQPLLQFSNRISKPVGSSNTLTACWNGSSWQTINYTNPGGYFYEEAMWWNIPKLSLGTRIFIVQNSSSANVSYFDSNGNIVLKGTCSQQATCTPSQDSFIFKDNSNNAVAYINSTGNLCIETGDCSDNSASCNPSNDAFIIQDSSGNNVSYIDLTNGDLCLTGTLIEQGNP